MSGWKRGPSDRKQPEKRNPGQGRIPPGFLSIGCNQLGRSEMQHPFTKSERRKATRFRGTLFLAQHGPDDAIRGLTVCVDYAMALPRPGGRAGRRYLDRRAG